MKINVAIIGLGVVGKKRKYFIEKNSKYNLVAASDIRFKKNFVRNKILYFKNFNEIFKLNIKIDAIFITLPNYLSAKVTIKAIKKGIHVFCEKPPAKNYNELLKVKKFIKSRVKLKYGFNHRYHGSIQLAKKYIDSKKLGKILNIRGLYGKSKILTYTKSDWRSKKKFAGGGILTDQGIHMLDIIKFFCGEFNEFKSFVSNKYWNYDVEDDVFAIMRNKTNILASIHSTALQWEHKFRLEISLERGSIICNGILSGSKTYGRESITVIMNSSKKKYFFIKDNSWKNEVDEFANIITNNCKVEIGNIKDALDVMKMIYRIYNNDKRRMKQ
tara:strand:+ start:896 stop:1882 length:987 start_codon:yes stop_codon:yes gene_type:complete